MNLFLWHPFFVDNIIYCLFLIRIMIMLFVSSSLYVSSFVIHVVKLPFRIILYNTYCHLLFCIILCNSCCHLQFVSSFAIHEVINYSYHVIIWIDISYSYHNQQIVSTSNTVYSPTRIGFFKSLAKCFSNSSLVTPMHLNTSGEIASIWSHPRIFQA